MQSWPVGPQTVSNSAPATFTIPGGSYSIAAVAFINQSSLLIFCDAGGDGPFLCGPGGSVLVPFGGQPAQASAAPGSIGSGPVLAQYMDADMAAIWTPPGMLTPQAANPGGSIPTSATIATTSTAGPILPVRTDGGQYTIYSANLSGWYTVSGATAKQQCFLGIPDPLNPGGTLPLLQFYLLPLTNGDRDHAELSFPNPLTTIGPVNLAVDVILNSTTVATGSVLYSR